MYTNILKIIPSRAFASMWDGTLYLVIVLSVSSVRSEKRGPVACSSAAEAAALTCDSRDS